MPSFACFFIWQAFCGGFPRARLETWRAGVGVVNEASGFKNLSCGGTQHYSVVAVETAKVGCRLRGSRESRLTWLGAGACRACRHTHPVRREGRKGPLSSLSPSIPCAPLRGPFAAYRERQLSMGSRDLARGSDTVAEPMGCLQYGLPCGPRGGLQGACDGELPRPLAPLWALLCSEGRPSGSWDPRVGRCAGWGRPWWPCAPGALTSGHQVGPGSAR